MRGLGLRGTVVVPYNSNDEKSVTTHGLSATCPVGSVLTPIRCCAACSESRNLRQAQRLQDEQSRNLSHMMLSSISIVILSSQKSVHSYLGQHSKPLRLKTIAVRFLMDAASRRHRGEGLSRDAFLSRGIGLAGGSDRSGGLRL